MNYFIEDIYEGSTIELYKDPEYGQPYSRRNGNVIPSNQVGATWSKEVYDYLDTDLNSARISQFFRDYENAVSENFFRNFIKQVDSSLNPTQG